MANPTIDIAVAVRIKPVNKPTEQIILKCGDAEVRVSAQKAARLLLAPYLNGSAAADTPRAALAAQRPAIGEQGLYGLYAGIARADAKGGDHVLELLEGDHDPLTWDAAMKWAASVGGTLPTRKQQALLFANVPEGFKKEAYWSCEPYAGDASFAWYQHFDTGRQSTYRKCYQLRARAGRRLPLE